MLLERIRILTDEKEQTNEIRRYLYRVIEQIEDELNRMDGTGNGAEDAKAYTDKMISELEIPSLEGYATETYVKNAINNAVPDLSGYATKSYAESQASTAESNAKDYTDAEIKKLSIPSLEGYATEDFAKSQAAEAEKSANSYTDKALENLEIPSLEGYATETYVKNAINNAVPDLSIIGDTDISEIDDGTLTGAVAYLSNMLGDVASVLDAVNRTVV